MYFSVTRKLKERAEHAGISLFPKVVVKRNLDLEKFLIQKPLNPNIAVQRPVVQNRSYIPIGARGRKRNPQKRSTNNFLYIGVKPNPDGHKEALNEKTTAPSHANASSVPLPSQPKLSATSTLDRPNPPKSLGKQMNLVRSNLQPKSPPISSLATYKPAIRTYGRLTSVPLPNNRATSNTATYKPAIRTYGRLTSTPLPSKDGKERQRIDFGRMPEESPIHQPLPMDAAKTTINIDFDYSFGRLNYSSDTE